MSLDDSEVVFVTFFPGYINDQSICAMELLCGLDCWGTSRSSLLVDGQCVNGRPQQCSQLSYRLTGKVCIAGGVH